MSLAGALIAKVARGLFKQFMIATFVFKLPSHSCHVPSPTPQPRWPTT